MRCRVFSLWCVLISTHWITGAPVARYEGIKQNTRLRYATADIIYNKKFMHDCWGGQRKADLEAYYINLNSSRRRRSAMEGQFKELELNVTRIAGITTNQIYVDEMANFSFKSGADQLATVESSADYVVDILHGQRVRMKPGYHDHSNTPKELACLMSHLVAIFEAVHSSDCSRYALILEDDVKFGFQIDFAALLKSAPAFPWGTLQLFTNNANVIAQQFELFRGNSEKMWSQRRCRAEWWSLGASIIDKVRWKRVLDNIVYVGVNGKLHFKIIASVKRRRNWKCVPYQCCDERGSYKKELPCFISYTGFQADMLLYEYLPTFLLNIPVFNLLPEMAKESNVQEQKRAGDMSDLTNTVYTTVKSITSKYYDNTYSLPSSNIINYIPKKVKR